MKRSLLGITLVLAASTGFSADICVDASNTTGQSDGSAVRPYTTLQTALASASSGDRVLVAAGSYGGGIRIESRVIELRGGYTGGTPSSYESMQPGDFGLQDPSGNPTILQGTPDGSVVLLIEAGASTLDGFTITGGGGAGEDAFRSQGAGVYVSGGAPTISRNRITGNDARNTERESFGGGIFTTDANTIIENNTISANYAGRGAGISVSGGMPIVRGNTINANIGTGDHGGGIYAFSPNILITNNVITRNEIGRDLGYGWGGGIIIFNPGANATISHNVVSGNFSASRGPGVFIDEGASASMDHCLIVNNLSDPDVGMGAVYVDGGFEIGSALTMTHCTVAGHIEAEPRLGGNGLFVEGDSSAIVENCIFWDNAGFSLFATPDSSFAVSYSTTQEAYPGAGNLTSDPLFVDAANGDFHLRSTAGHWVEGGRFVIDAVHSPAIDAANPASPFLLEPLGNGGRANQGAYGNTPQASRTSPPPIDATGWTTN